MVVEHPKALDCDADSQTFAPEGHLAGRASHTRRQASCWSAQQPGDTLDTSNSGTDSSTCCPCSVDTEDGPDALEEALQRGAWFSSRAEDESPTGESSPGSCPAGGQEQQQSRVDTKQQRSRPKRRKQGAQQTAARAAAGQQEGIEEALYNWDVGPTRSASALAGLVWALSCSKVGCCEVQRALRHSSREERLQMAGELKGRVLDASRSASANFVLQCLAELLLPADLQFIVDELQGHAAAVARHRFGCRALQKLVVKCPGEQVGGLVAELLEHAAELARHRFGNYVMQLVVEHGLPAQRQQVLDVLESDLQDCVTHRMCSHVIQRAAACDADCRLRLGSALSMCRKKLARTEYGSFVAKLLA